MMSSDQRFLWVVNRIRSVSQLTKGSLIKFDPGPVMYDVFDSDSESQFLYVLETLQENGYIEVKRPPIEPDFNSLKPRYNEEAKKLVKGILPSLQNHKAGYGDGFYLIEIKPQFIQATDDEFLKQTQLAKKQGTGQFKVEPRSYDAASGILVVGGYRVEIIKQEKKKGKLNETKEGRLLRLLFKDVNTLRDGVAMRSVLSVKSTDFNAGKRKLVKNYTSVINKKVADAVGDSSIKPLLITDRFKVMIDSSYL